MCTQNQFGRQSEASIWPNNCNDIRAMLDLLQIQHFGPVCDCVCAAAAKKIFRFLSFGNSHFLANARCRCLRPNFRHQRNHVSLSPLLWLPLEVKLESASGDNVHCSQIAWLESVFMWRIDWSKKNTRNLGRIYFTTDVLKSFLWNFLISRNSSCW